MVVARAAQACSSGALQLAEAACRLFPDHCPSISSARNACRRGRLRINGCQAASLRCAAPGGWPGPSVTVQAAVLLPL